MIKTNKEVSYKSTTVYKRTSHDGCETQIMIKTNPSICTDIAVKRERL
jgi:hypothetical protein